MVSFLFLVKNPVRIGCSMDFGHHVKFPVDIVLGSAVVGVVHQNLPVGSDSPEDDEMPAACK